MTGPAVLVFVQRACGACHEYMPRFTRAVAPYHVRGLPVHVIDIAADPRGAAMADRFKVKATPTTVVVGRTGTHRREGAISDIEIRRLLERA